MRIARCFAALILSAVVIGAVGADVFAPHDFATQYREHTNQGPSRQFPLGTDELGRDRFSRLLYGSRISLVCAPVAAFAATVIGTIIGVIGGYYGRLLRELTRATADLFLSVPWLFALLLLRALLPLNVSSEASVLCTFGLLAGIGWASGARVIQTAVVRLRFCPAVVHARACGCGEYRLLCWHILPNIKGVCATQFWILVPVFLLAEANLGLLGLGVVEPLPSWGNMLGELQNYERIREAPWILVPAGLLVVVVCCLHLLVSEYRTWE